MYNKYFGGFHYRILKSHVFKVIAIESKMFITNLYINSYTIK